jgi:outer membrane protein OmpA-like peptidoglycan-associated protein
MKRYCTVLFFFLLPGLYAQQYVPELVSKKAKAIYQKAIQAADREDFEQALRYIDQALEKDSRYVDAMLSRAGILGQLKRYADAVKSYEQAFAVDPGYTREYQLPYSINLTGMGRFEEALAAVNDFLSIPSLSVSSVKAGQYRKNNILFALQQQAAFVEPFDPGFRNAGDAINTTDPEYFPSLTIDGRTLVFTRRVNWRNEDFFSALAQGNSWEKATPLDGTVNSAFNEGAQQISQDGKWLVFTGCDFPDGYGSCDLYISYRGTDGWSKPQNLGPQINTEAWETSPCLSPDKQALYFSSTRPGGYGAADLYVSRLMPNGRWSAPENLGPAINTAGDEKAPFMHADNETLYFTSDGLQGYGGSDIFLAKKTLTGFERPLNLGFPINTIDNEGSLIVSSDGRTAFYASDRPEGKGGLDIYSFRLREELRPLNTTWVQGRIYDSLTGKGMPALVELVDLQSKRLVMQVQADAEGNYLTSLPKGRNYAFSVNKKGYLFHSGRFALQGLDTVQYFNQDIAMQPLAAGANITLRNILFETGKHELLPASFVELDRVVVLLQENAALKVQINGHTDNIGQPQDNQLLSENRAKSVVDFLVSRGIQPTRLSYKGFGATAPVADNATEQGRSLNRRTEMLVVSGS